MVSRYDAPDVTYGLMVILFRWFQFEYNIKRVKVKKLYFTGLQIGDALTDYKDNKLGHSNASNVNTETGDKFNYNLMKWQQFHYKFVVSEDGIASCTEFYLEVQNNEPPHRWSRLCH